MSRCFPYPPPGYSRNGATYEALIESIKLQKENDKAKGERKKEKRAKKEKKEKRKRKDEEKAKVKLQNNPNEYQHDAHKVVKGSVDVKEAHSKKTEPTIEQLERSDLTEEHGQPIISNKPSYSSECSQNSIKRKRDDAIFADGSSGHGKPIKIRLLKKQRPDSSKETLCSNSGRTDLQGLSSADVRLSNLNVSTSGNTGPSVPSMVLSNRYSGVPATSGRENNAAHGIPLSQTKLSTNFGRPGRKNDQQGLQYGRQQLVPGSALKQETRTPNLNKTDVPVPSRSIKSDVEGLISSRQQAIPSHGRRIQSHMENRTATPSSIMPPAPSVARKIDAQGYGPGREQLSLRTGTLVLPSNHMIHDVPKSDLSKTKSSLVRKRSINEINNSGSSKLEKKKEDLIGDVPAAGTSNGQKVSLSRTEKKMKKKHNKYEKLIGSWVPPVLEAQVLEADDDEDWLSRRGKSGGCLSRIVVDTCRDSAASSLWQPCARFLADADIQALPYTVPF